MSVDPRGFEPLALRVDGSMLTRLTPRALGHAMNYTTKKPPDKPVVL